MEAALDRTGDMQILLSLQETMRGAIKRKTMPELKYVAPYTLL